MRGNRLTTLYGGYPTKRDHCAALRAKGLKPGAIAEVMNISVVSVYSHLTQARKLARTAAQTAGLNTGPREAGVNQGALPGGGDSPPVPAPVEKAAAGAPDPPSGHYGVGKGADRATRAAANGGSKIEKTILPDAAVPPPGTVHPLPAPVVSEGRRAGRAAPGKPPALAVAGDGPPGAARAVHEISSIVDLEAWAMTAQPGERCCYFRGVLACARSLRGAAAMALAERGLVDLVQVRHGADDYAYLAVRRAGTTGRARP